VVAVPLRVPPPQADSQNAMQWVMDALFHLDECIDDGKKDTGKRLDELKSSVEDKFATIFSMIASKEEDHLDLGKRIEDHLSFHKTIDAVLEERKRQQKKLTDTAWEVGKEVGKVAAGAIGAGLLYMITRLT
jgi:hypothetical protein